MRGVGVWIVIRLLVFFGFLLLRVRSYNIDVVFFCLDGIFFDKYFLNVCYVLGIGNIGESMWICF